MFEETILIVEDDIQIQNLIKYTLEKEDYQTLCTDKGRQMVEMAMTEKMDMIPLDMGLPDTDGREVLAKLREWLGTPVIIVSTRDQEKEKVTTLDTGADDYLTKPFPVNELLTRIRLAFHHYFRMDGEKTSSHIKNGELEVDNDKHTASRAGEEVHLTKLEFAPLFLFMRNQGKVLTYGYILKEFYGRNYGLDTQAFRALMAGLCRKIEENPAKPRYITIEIGIGYRIMEQ